MLLLVNTPFTFKSLDGRSFSVSFIIDPFSKYFLIILQTIILKRKLCTSSLTVPIEAFTLFTCKERKTRGWKSDVGS